MHNFNLHADCVLDNGVNASVACFVKVFVLEMFCEGFCPRNMANGFNAGAVGG